MHPVEGARICLRSKGADNEDPDRVRASESDVLLSCGPRPLHAGLTDAGHTSEVVDLYAMKFNPVFTRDDYSFFAHESVPSELLDESELRANMVTAAGGPIRRRVAKRWLRDKDLAELISIVAKQRPKDVLAHQEKVAAADGLAFIAPIMWMNFPAILRGWVERVFTYGFVYTMTREGWLQGDLSGRQPLLHHRKALIMTPTFFRESDYRDSGCGAAIERLVDDFGFPLSGNRAGRARLLLRR